MSEKILSQTILSRSDVVSAIAAQTNQSVSGVDAVVKAYESVIAAQLESGGEVRLPGFGTFKTADRPGRTARNPRTGEPLEIAARSVVRFVLGKGLKEIGAKK